ncbi:TPA: putative adhesin [Serratia marcescens]
MMPKDSKLLDKKKKNTQKEEGADIEESREMLNHDNAFTNNSHRKFNRRPLADIANNGTEYSPQDFAITLGSCSYRPVPTAEHNRFKYKKSLFLFLLLIAATGGMAMWFFSNRSSALKQMPYTPIMDIDTPDNFNKPHSIINAAGSFGPRHQKRHAPTMGAPVDTNQKTLRVIRALPQKSATQPTTKHLGKHISSTNDLHDSFLKYNPAAFKNYLLDKYVKDEAFLNDIRHEVANISGVYYHNFISILINARTLKDIPSYPEHMHSFIYEMQEYSQEIYQHQTSKKNDKSLAQQWLDADDDQISTAESKREYLIATANSSFLFCLEPESFLAILDEKYEFNEADSIQINNVYKYYSQDNDDSIEKAMSDGLTLDPILFHPRFQSYIEDINHFIRQSDEELTTSWSSYFHLHDKVVMRPIAVSNYINNSTFQSLSRLGLSGLDPNQVVSVDAECFVGCNPYVTSVKEFLTPLSQIHAGKWQEMAIHKQISDALIYIPFSPVQSYLRINKVSFPDEVEINFKNGTLAILTHGNTIKIDEDRSISFGNEIIMHLEGMSSINLSKKETRLYDGPYQSMLFSLERTPTIELENGKIFKVENGGGKIILDDGIEITLKKGRELPLEIKNIEHAGLSLSQYSDDVDTLYDENHSDIHASKEHQIIKILKSILNNEKLNNELSLKDKGKIQSIISGESVDGISVISVVPDVVTYPWRENEGFTRDFISLALSDDRKLFISLADAPQPAWIVPKDYGLDYNKLTHDKFYKNREWKEWVYMHLPVGLQMDNIGNLLDNNEMLGFDYKLEEFRGDCSDIARALINTEKKHHVMNMQQQISTYGERALKHFEEQLKLARDILLSAVGGGIAHTITIPLRGSSLLRTLISGIVGATFDTGMLFTEAITVSSKEEREAIYSSMLPSFALGGATAMIPWNGVRGTSGTNKKLPRFPAPPGGGGLSGASKTNPHVPTFTFSDAKVEASKALGMFPDNYHNSLYQGNTARPEFIFNNGLHSLNEHSNLHYRFKFNGDEKLIAFTSKKDITIENLRGRTGEKVTTAYIYEIDTPPNKADMDGSKPNKKSESEGNHEMDFTLSVPAENIKGAYIIEFNNNDGWHATGYQNNPRWVPQTRGRGNSFHKNYFYRESTTFTEIPLHSRKSKDPIGYRTLGDGHYVQILSKSTEGESAGASTLVVGCHGGYCPSDRFGASPLPPVALPADMVIKFMTPDNSLLIDPSFDFIVNNPSHYQAYATLIPGKDPDVNFYPQPKGEFPENYKPKDRTNTHGIESSNDEVFNYRHYQYEGESPGYLAAIVDRNRVKAQDSSVPLTDIMVVNTKLDLKYEPEGYKYASTQVLIDMDRDGTLVNANGERYKVIIFAHCRNILSNLESGIPNYRYPEALKRNIERVKGVKNYGVLEIVTLRRDDVNHEFKETRKPVALLFNLEPRTVAKSTKNHNTKESEQAYTPEHDPHIDSHPEVRGPVSIVGTGHVGRPLNATDFNTISSSDVSEHSSVENKMLKNKWKDCLTIAWEREASNGEWLRIQSDTNFLNSNSTYFPSADDIGHRVRFKAIIRGHNQNSNGRELISEPIRIFGKAPEITGEVLIAPHLYEGITNKVEIDYNFLSHGWGGDASVILWEWKSHDGKWIKDENANQRLRFYYPHVFDGRSNVLRARVIPRGRDSDILRGKEAISKPIVLQGKLESPNVKVSNGKRITRKALESALLENNDNVAIHLKDGSWTPEIWLPRPSVSTQFISIFNESPNITNIYGKGRKVHRVIKPGDIVTFHSEGNDWKV